MATMAKTLLFVGLIVGAPLLGGCSEPSRPLASEIEQIHYWSCLENFKPCEGKFIKFDGVIVSADGGYYRIKNSIHGFDVFISGKPDPALVGAKVMFSGYLNESHMINDDVKNGKIEAVLISAAEVNFQTAMAADKKSAYEAAHPTCAKDWNVCTSNIDLARNNRVWFDVSSACYSATNRQARYGKPNWTWSIFQNVMPGNSFRTVGQVTAVDEDVSFQNGFGASGKSRVVCVYDLGSKRVVNLTVTPL